MTLSRFSGQSKSSGGGRHRFLIFVGLQIHGSMKFRAATEQACQENFAGIYVSLQNNPAPLRLHQRST
jgi:hypothetical protein